MKRQTKVVFLAVVAVTVSSSAVLAASSTFFQATQTGYYDGTQTDTYLNKTGLFFQNSIANQIRFWGGADEINMGPGDDILHMSSGKDYIFFGGDDEDGVITFDTAGQGPINSVNSECFIRAENPDSSPFIEIQAADVQITSNNGDVVIQLGG